MYTIYSGNTGSGKSTVLKRKYRKLAEDYGSDKILLFLNSAKSVNSFRENFRLNQSGNLNVFTYFGFVNQELNIHWPTVEKAFSGANNVIEPTFMNIETSHFLMSNYVEKYRENKLYFKNIKAKSVQIAVQLIDNLNLAAFNMLEFEELKSRLHRWTANDEERNKYAEQSSEIMKTFRNFCLKYRLIDYSTSVTLYNKYLLANSNYISDLLNKYKYVLTDDLEKMIPAGQHLLKKLTNSGVKAFFTFNKSGGFNRFFGGNPEAAEKKFFPDAEQIISLDKNYTASQKSDDLAENIEKVIKKQDGNIIKSELLKGEIDSELRGEMLLKVGKKIVSLLKSGVKADSIAVISPKIDKVLSFSLERILEQNGYKINNFNRSKRLVDIPFARALLILYLFQSGKTEMIGISSLQQTLSLLLELDPIRSYILAEEITASGMKLIDLENSGLRSRINFSSAEKYDYLRDWLNDKKSEDLDIEIFFQDVFSELLAPLKPSKEDIFACRQMIESVGRFHSAVENFHQQKDDLSERYINMIYEGTLAAETLYKDDQEKGVILASPYKFLFSPELESVDYLFIIDISDKEWMRSVAKELVNPYIYTEEWSSTEEWNDLKDQQLRLQQLGDFLISLIYKVKKGIYISDSFLDSRGREQDGPLYRWLDVRGD